MSFIVLPLRRRRAAVAGSRAYRKWRGAARFADGDLLVRQDAGRTSDDDSALDGRGRLIERLQRRVELGEGAFLARWQAVGVVTADAAAHAHIENPGGLVGFRLAFPGQ